MNPQRPVLLLSNIPHSVFAAKALHDAGMLDRYLSPAILAPETRGSWLLPDRVRQARTYDAAAGLPMQPLLLQEATRRVLSTSRLSSTRQARADVSLMDMLVSRRIGRPLVLHMHSTGLLRTLDKAKTRGAYVVSDHRALHPRAAVYNDPLAGVLEDEFESADLVLVNSVLSARGMAAHGVDEKKIVVLPLGVDTDLFAPNKSEVLVDKAIKLLFVGVVNRTKGVDVLAAALDASSEHFDLRVAGREQDPVMSKTLRRLSSCHFLGVLTKTRLADEYRRADVLVLPSRSDAFGLVAVESLACGTPVVVTDQCGVADLIQRHGCGVVVPAGDAVAFRSALERLASDREAYAAAVRGCAPATREVSWDVYGEALVELYRSRVLPEARRSAE